MAPYSQAPTAPEGFEVIDLAEAERLARTGTFRWLTEAGRSRDEAQAAARDADDRRRIDALAARDPALAGRIADPRPGPGVEALQDGNWRIARRPGDPGSPAHVTQGRHFVVQDLAAGYREGATRANREGIYRTLLAALPEDLRVDLPPADDLAALADATLDAAITTVTERVTTQVEDAGLPTNPEPLAESFPSPISGLPGLVPSGCLTFGPAGLYARNSWPLKNALTPVRDQGGRGTCASFAIAGAIETFVRQNYGRAADLSEQSIYGTARGEWEFTQPTWADGRLFFGDGLGVATTIDRMLQTAFPVYGEAGWRYNPSLSREVAPRDAENRRLLPYRDSCVGYAGTCTDTNHQQRATCVNAPTGWHCAFWNALDASGQDSERYTVLSRSNLWVALPGMGSEQVAAAALASARAHLAAGKPVAFAMTVDEGFAAAAPATLVTRLGVRIVNPAARLSSRTAGGARLGAHAMVMVGFVSFASIDAAAAAAGIPRAERMTYQLDAATEGDGFFVIKNSWGCDWGDGGYTYATPAYLRSRLHAAVAITGVLGAAPSVSLAVNRSSVTSTAQEVLLVADGNALVRKVEFYRVEGLTTTKLGEDLDAPYKRTFTLPPGTEGKLRYFAVATDSAGNRASSNVVALNADVPGVPPPPDLVRPKVTLSAGAAAVTAPANVVLTATPTAGTYPIQRVEFYVNAMKFAEATAAPYARLYPLTFREAPRAVFEARAFDTRGNFSGMAAVTVDVALPPAPTIASFGASPSTTPPGGGAVTLAWSVSGANLLAIDNEVGSVTGQSSVVVSPRRTTTYTLTATNSGGPTSAATTVTVPPPAVASFTATPASLPPGGGAVTLAWSVVGANSVQVTGLGSVEAAGSATVYPLVTTAYTLTASALSGSTASTLTVAVAPDTQAPTVSLLASASTVIAPGSVTLVATADDDIAVTAVDFLRNGVRIGTDTTPGDGFTLNVPLGTGDVGSQSFTAEARDPSNNVGTSAPVVVTVSVPNPADRWVSPTGSDAHPGTEAQPYQSVGKALANAGSGGTVRLADGTYPWANENGRNGYSQLDFKTLRVPANVSVRASASGAATLLFGLDHQGDSTVFGVRYSSSATDVSDQIPTAVSSPASGHVQLKRVSFDRVGTMIYTRGGDITFDAEGDTAHAWLAEGFSARFGRVDLGHVRILGGVMAPGRLPDASNVSSRGFGTYGYSGRLTFEGAQLIVPTAPAGVGQVVFAPIQGGQFVFGNSQATQLGTPPYSVLAQVDSSSSVQFTNSVVGGRFTHVVAHFAGGNVRVENSTLEGGVYAIGPTGGDEPAGAPLPTVTVTDSTIRGFVIGISLTNGGTLTVRDSTIRDNSSVGIHLPAVEYLPYRSAVYQLTLRNSTVAGNGTGAAGQGGIRMVGAATAVFDLGTATDPGGNMLTGGDTLGPALRVDVQPGVTVSAVGNRWVPLAQGADTSGAYAGNVVATSGSGVNFVLTSGALRLAGAP